MSPASPASLARRFARLPTGRPCPDSKARCRCAPVCCARVEHGWRGGGGWGHGRRGAGPARSSGPKTVFPGGRGTREAVFLLETSSTADATARTVLTGQAVQTIPCGCGPFLPSWARGENQTWTWASPGSRGHIHLRRPRDSHAHPTGLVRLNLKFWGRLGVGVGLGLDLALDSVLFASAHCVISRPVLARWLAGWAKQ